MSQHENQNNTLLIELTTALLRVTRTEASLTNQIDTIGTYRIYLSLVLSVVSIGLTSTGWLSALQAGGNTTLNSRLLHCSRHDSLLDCFGTECQGARVATSTDAQIDAVTRLAKFIASIPQICCADLKNVRREISLFGLAFYGECNWWSA